MKKLLVVIDMQNDFVTGALGTPEAEAIVPQVEQKIRIYQPEGWETVFTKDTHTEAYLTTREGQALPVPHCIQHTPGWELIPSLVPYAHNSKIFEKPTFGSLTLAAYAQQSNYTEIELIGLCTDICVISNALLLKAHLPESIIRVDSACCAGVTPASHQTALAAMKTCQIEIT